MAHIADAVTALIEGAPVAQVVEGTIEDIRKGHKGHFFDPSTMKFFKSRVHGTTYEGPGGTHFVTSEQTPSWGGGSGRRRFSVRRVDPETGMIRKAGEFLGYKTRAQAHSAARAAAAKAPKARPEQIGDVSKVTEAVRVQNINRSIRVSREPATGAISAGGAYDAPLDWNRSRPAPRPASARNVNFNVRTVHEPSTGDIAAGGAYEAPGAADLRAGEMRDRIHRVGELRRRKARGWRDTENPIG